MKEFGGKPLTPTLEAVFSSRYVAGLDRDLNDRIDASAPDRQQGFVCRESEIVAESHGEWRSDGGSAIVVRHADFECRV
ncbi:hypothetical protein, partial [Rhodococcus sp. T7]|uniref:hypothetical protein n=1 Tax=Rhodococcus sp. T7 TaxID=627444 RepID=UPI001F3E7A59